LKQELFRYTKEQAALSAYIHCCSSPGSLGTAAVQRGLSLGEVLKHSVIIMLIKWLSLVDVGSGG